MSEHMPVGENDGPLGSSVLAAALTRSGHRLTIYTDPVCASPIEALVKRNGCAAQVVRLTLGESCSRMVKKSETPAAVLA